MDDEGEVVPKNLPFGTDYARSSRAQCRTCKENIMQGELRMSVRIQSQAFDGMQDCWHHFDCFWSKKRNITEASIRCFESLRWEDQERIRALLPEVVASKTVKTTTIQTTTTVLSQAASPSPQPSTQAPPSLAVEYAKSDKSKCASCKLKIEHNAIRIRYKNSSYHPACISNMSVFNGSGDDIHGFADLKDDEQALLKSLFSPDIITDDPPAPSPPKKARLSDSPEKVEALKQQSQAFWTVLDDIRGKINKETAAQLLRHNGTCGFKNGSLNSHLEQLADLIVFGGLPHCTSCGGGLLRFSSDEHAYKCCYFISQYTRCSYFTRNPSRSDFRVPADLLERYDFLSKYDGKKLIPGGRVYPLSVESGDIVSMPKVSANKRKQLEKRPDSEERRCIVKNGCTVDPRCEVAEKVHVYIEDKKPWQALLGSADLASGRNSFYKLQLVKHDSRESYYVFRSWGRVGANVGGCKTESFADDLEGAKELFEKLFYEKSQNSFENIEHFIKQPTGLDLIEMEVDSSKAENLKRIDAKESKSSLPLATREVIGLFFDIQLMKEQMAEFELDIEKMPLGKMSRRQLLSAHSVLSELSEVLSQENPTRDIIIDLCNRFYTIIPHSAGVGQLPLINTADMLKKKTEMVDSLLEMEIAYKLVEQEQKDEEKSGEQEMDPFDSYYNKLECDIELLAHESEEFKMIELYAKNTHMATHHFKIRIKAVFKVKRHGENERYMKASKNISNKRLLWHGSRTSNFCGILSRGLCIAPPEAPVNGYMFGKGLYFADCVSKSAQYCSTSGRNDGFLLLAEVALGNMQEEKHARDIRKPKKGFHSVKGIGGTAPDEKGSITLKDDVLVPCGKAKPVNKKDLSLLYNEYIVYKEDQACIRYLIHMEME